MLTGEALPLGTGTRPEDLLDLSVRLRARRIELVGLEVLAADAIAPRGEELRLERAERDPAVGARVGPVAEEATCELLLPAPLRHSVREPARSLEAQPRQRAVEHRHVDELALA